MADDNTAEEQQNADQAVERERPERPELPVEPRRPGKDEIDNKLEGTDESELLQGTDGVDGIRGHDGDDTINGGDSDDWLFGEFGDDVINGGAGTDRMHDGSGNDILNGGEGDDLLRSSLGSDTLDGGAGDDVLLSLADDGEPDPDQDPSMRVEPEFTGPTDDVLTGGSGADSFIFRPLIDAKEEIIEKHTDPETGKVNWKGVAGENDNIHDHWVNGIGNDVITDFNAAEGDQLIISGHTVDTEFSYGDSDGDGVDDYTIITLFSNQYGKMHGMEMDDMAPKAHHGDALGTITVLDAILTEDDIFVGAGTTAAVNRLDTWDL